MQKVLLVVFTLISINLFSQINVKEGSFRKIDGYVMLDKKEHLDDNDNPMALIKITTENISAEQRAKFYFNGNLETFFDKQLQDDGQLYLYISAVASFVEIIHPEYGKTEYHFPFDLCDFCGYEMVVQYVGMQNASEQNYLIVKSDNANAKIYIDEEYVGNQFAHKQFLVGSTHKWKMECDLYRTECGNITITNGENLVDITMLPEFGYLNITTDPENGAQVYINDSMVGVTPYKSDKLSIGNYTIKVVNGQFKTAEKMVVVKDKETSKLNIPFVEVTVKTDSNSDIYIDGKYQGKGRWNGKLFEGEYLFEARKGNHRKISKRERIFLGGNVNINLALPDPIEGSLEIDGFADKLQEENGHEYVDLGLSVKWATCNVGATSPEDYGGYYAWGETTTKTNFSSDNSKTYGEIMKRISGNAQYDAARNNWGGRWRMPTESEMQELIYKCIWIWTTQNGVSGYKVTGPNGNSIFLPATGCRSGSSLDDAGIYGYYWSSTPINGIVALDYLAYDLGFNSDNRGIGRSRRYNGQSVRPVLDVFVVNVTINTDSQSDIYVDGKLLGKGKWSGRLSEDTHLIEARKTSHTSTFKKVNLTVGMTEVINIESPKPICGYLEISSDPILADIYIDGKYYGQTPNVIYDLLIGEHELKLSKQGCAEMKKTISIKEGETLVLNEKLQTGKEITITTDIILNNGEVSVQSLGESAPIRLKVVSASCSNNLAPQGNNTYGPWNMLDGNPATVWAVNLNDPSIRNYEGDRDRDCIYGPWFDVKCKKLSHIVIHNGYGKSTSSFINNSRASRVAFEIEVNGELEWFEFPLRDDPSPQHLNVPLNIEGNNNIISIQLVLDSRGGGIIKGEKWNDLCISEIEFWGWE